MAILLACGSCRRQFRVKDQFRGTRLKCPGCRQEVLVEGRHVRGYDVFISYSSRDQQVADAVCAALESKAVRCWMAPRDIPAGASWGAAIIEGIEDSHLLLLVFSEHSNQSAQVLREVERAVAKKRPLVPLRIDRTNMGKAFEYFLASCHWLDATDGALEAHLGTLTSTIRAMLLSRAETAADSESHATEPALTLPLAVTAIAGKRFAPKKLAVAAAVILIAGLAFAIFRFGGRGDQHGEDQATAATVNASSSPSALATRPIEARPSTGEARTVSTQPASRERVFTHDGPVTSVVLEPGRDLLVTATDNGQPGGAATDSIVRRWSLSTGRQGAVFGPTPGEHVTWAVKGLALSPDGGRLAVTRNESVTGNAHLTAWDVNDQRILSYFPVEGRGGMERPWFTPDGTGLFVTRTYGEIREFDLGTGEQRQAVTIWVPNRLEWVDTCMSQNRSSVFIAMARGGVAERDVRSGNMKHRFGTDLPGTQAVCVSSGTKFVAAGFKDGAVRVWRVATKELVATLPQGKSVLAVSFVGTSNDRLISGDESGAAILWDIAAGVAVKRYTGHAGAIKCLSISPDGTLFVTGSADKTGAHLVNRVAVIKIKPPRVSSASRHCGLHFPA